MTLLVLFLLLLPAAAGCSESRITPSAPLAAAPSLAPVSPDSPPALDDLRVASDLWAAFYSQQGSWLRTEGALWGCGEEKLASSIYDADSVLTELVLKLYEGEDTATDRLRSIRAILFGFHEGFLYGHRDAAAIRLHIDKPAQLSFCDELVEAAKMNVPAR